MKVMVTGAFGNLGQMVVAELLDNEHQVTCFDVASKANRKVAKRYEPTTQIHWGDIRDKALIEQLVKDVDAVIHLAAILPPLADSSPDFAYAVNVTGTQNLLDAMHQHAPEAVMIYPSSVTVFGNAHHLERPLTIADPISGTDNYTRHKVACENLLQSASIPWVIMRVGVSVDARTTSTTPDMIRKMFETRAGNRLEFVHPRDVARAMGNAVTRPAAWNKVLLLGGGASCQVTQREFLQASVGAIGVDIPEAAHGETDYYTHWMDTEEAQRLLDFQRISFDDYREEMRESLKWPRRVLTPLRPLVRYGLLRLSPPWQRYRASARQK